MINSYSFGQIVIDGRHYCSDVEIFPEGLVNDSWRRMEGHVLHSGDIIGLLESKPEVLIVGTGAYGCMIPADDILEELGERGIEMIALPSDEAMAEYNLLKATKCVAACFHLTC